MRAGPRLKSRGIELTRVWPSSITHDELSQSLSEQLNGFSLALEFTVGFHEFAYDFASYLRRTDFEAGGMGTPTDCN